MYSYVPVLTTFEQFIYTIAINKQQEKSNRNRGISIGELGLKTRKSGVSYSKNWCLGGRGGFCKTRCTEIEGNDGGSFTWPRREENTVKVCRMSTLEQFVCTITINTYVLCISAEYRPNRNKTTAPSSSEPFFGVLCRYCNYNIALLHEFMPSARSA